MNETSKSWPIGEADKKNLEFDKNKAYRRYNLLFRNLANELK